MSEEKKPKSIIDIIEEVGIDNISVQSVHTSMTEIKSMKKGTKITFMTEPVDDVMPIANGERIGLICWFDRKHLNG